MSTEKHQKLEEMLSEIEKDISRIRSLQASGVEFGDVKLYKAVDDAFEKINNLVEFVEDNDENLNVHKSPLGGKVDKLFKNDPISDLIKSSYNFDSGCTGDKITCKNPDGCSCYASKEENKMEALLEKVKNLSTSYYAEMYIIMDDVEDKLAKKTEYTDTDIALIREYFRHLPYYSSADVDGWSDNEVLKAFKQRMYVQGKLD